MDAGADTTTAMRQTTEEGGGRAVSPLALADYLLSAKKIGERNLTEEELNSLEAIRRLLMRVEAVHAASWLWPSDVPSIVGTGEGVPTASRTSTPLTLMLPILRRRTRRRGMVLAAMLRWVPYFVVV